MDIQPFWRARPSMTSKCAKDDLAYILETIVMTFNLCVQTNYQRQLTSGVQTTEEKVATHLRDFCLKEMFNNSRVYKYNLSLQIDRLDFNNVVTQWGYMYVYMCRHIHLVHHSMTDALRTKSIAVNARAKNSVCAIGGGPGSDLLGLLIFFRENGMFAPFSEINILDRCTAWKESWVSLQSKLPGQMAQALPCAEYHHFDFFNDVLTDNLRKIIQRSTFITFIKAISPVSAWLKDKSIKYTHYLNGRVISHWHSVYSILQCVQPGAIVLYVDNSMRNGSVHRRIIMDSALLLGFRVLYERNLRDVRMPCDSFSDNCKRLMRFLEFRPCSVAGDNDAIVLWKPGANIPPFDPRMSCNLVNPS